MSNKIYFSQRTTAQQFAVNSRQNGAAVDEKKYVFFSQFFLRLGTSSTGRDTKYWPLLVKSFSEFFRFYFNYKTKYLFFYIPRPKPQALVNVKLYKKAVLHQEELA